MSEIINDYLWKMHLITGAVLLLFSLIYFAGVMVSIFLNQLYGFENWSNWVKELVALEILGAVISVTVNESLAGMWLYGLSALVTLITMHLTEKPYD